MPGFCVISTAGKLPVARDGGNSFFNMIFLKNQVTLCRFSIKENIHANT
jgi:hypothetical protein